MLTRRFSSRLRIYTVTSVRVPRNRPSVLLSAA
jgi:hypothetical protein